MGHITFLTQKSLNSTLPLEVLASSFQKFKTKSPKQKIQVLRITMKKKLQKINEVQSFQIVTQFCNWYALSELISRKVSNTRMFGSQYCFLKVSHTY